MNGNIYIGGCSRIPTTTAAAAAAALLLLLTNTAEHSSWVAQQGSSVGGSKVHSVGQVGCLWARSGRPGQWIDVALLTSHII
jgi:hypothetical protein